MDASGENELNLYVYCGNNPVMMIDFDGTMPNWLKWFLAGVAIVAVAAIAVGITALTGGTATLGFATAVGAFKGSAIGLGIVAGVGFIGGYAVTGTSDSALDGMGYLAFGGAAIGAIAGGLHGWYSYQSSAITGFMNHGMKSVLTHDGHGVNAKAMIDAVANPKKIVPQVLRTKFKYIGQNAVVVLNKTGSVITAYAKNRSGWRIGLALWLSYDYHQEKWNY